MMLSVFLFASSPLPTIWTIPSVLSLCVMRCNRWIANFLTLVSRDRDLPLPRRSGTLPRWEGTEAYDRFGSIGFLKLIFCLRISITQPEYEMSFHNASHLHMLLQKRSPQPVSKPSVPPLINIANEHRLFLCYVFKTLSPPCLSVLRFRSMGWWFFFLLLH